MNKLFFVTRLELDDAWSGTRYAYVVRASNAEEAKIKLINGTGLPESERQWLHADVIEFTSASNIVLVGTFAIGD